MNLKINDNGEITPLTINTNDSLKVMKNVVVVVIRTRRRMIRIIFMTIVRFIIIVMIEFVTEGLAKCIKYHDAYRQFSSSNKSRPFLRVLVLTTTMKSRSRARARMLSTRPNISGVKSIRLRYFSDAPHDCRQVVKPATKKPPKATNIPPIGRACNESIHNTSTICWMSRHEKTLSVGIWKILIRSSVFHILLCQKPGWSVLYTVWITNPCCLLLDTFQGIRQKPL